MGPCIVSIFQYISNKMQRYTVYLYLQTALHVSGGTSTHHQKRIQLFLQHLVFVTPLLLPAAPDDGLRYHPKYVEQFPDIINCVTLHLVGHGKGKGKAIPLQAWTCPECSRRLRLPGFKKICT